MNSSRSTHDHRLSARGDQPTARVVAGVPAANSTLIWSTGVCVGDPVGLIEFLGPADGPRSVLILRDIEMARARRIARAERVACPADFTPPEQALSGDREIATAQAVAECLRRAGVSSVLADRSLPLVYAEIIQRAGIRVMCDLEGKTAARRTKSPAEIEHLRDAQRVTVAAVEMVCRLIAAAQAARDGSLIGPDGALTAELVRARIDHWMVDHGFTPALSIVACGAQGADCHDVGSGPLYTGQPIIVDVFPRHGQTHYCGDCTRTVVHGEVPPDISRMHEAVRRAKAAAIAAIRPGVTGEQVHQTTIASIESAGYAYAPPGRKASMGGACLTHGTGHGIGLDVHEPPLLDFGGPPLLCGEAITVEPGLYQCGVGGVRVEDIVLVTEAGGAILVPADEGLDWR